ncbi:hypothetical protein B0H13DRAFT_1879503 [Mycena leptocephala]|nr:hypothetical protein B0H13DRAFT_1879503 [Mycena leptocephala]
MAALAPTAFFFSCLLLLLIALYQHWLHPLLELNFGQRRTRVSSMGGSRSDGAFLDHPLKETTEENPALGGAGKGAHRQPPTPLLHQEVANLPYNMEDLENYSWLRLLHPQSITSLEVLAFPNESLHTALGKIVRTSPAVFALQRLIICAITLGDTAGLEKCLSNPALTHLGIIFLGGFARPPLSPRRFGTLQRLSIKAWGVIEDVPIIIHACGASLRRFDLTLTHSPDSNGYARLAAALHGAPQLEHIYFGWAESRPTSFLDGLALPRLRHLRAGACLYTAAFFSNLPPDLETLHLQYDRNDGKGTHFPNGAGDGPYFPVEAAVAGLSVHPALCSFTLSPDKSCPFIDFPGLVAASKSVELLVVSRLRRGVPGRQDTCLSRKDNYSDNELDAGGAVVAHWLPGKKSGEYGGEDGSNDGGADGY